MILQVLADQATGLCSEIRANASDDTMMVFYHRKVPTVVVRCTAELGNAQFAHFAGISITCVKLLVAMANQTSK